MFIYSLEKINLFKLLYWFYWYNINSTNFYFGRVSEILHFETDVEVLQSAL